MRNELSKQEARKLILSSQGLINTKENIKSLDKTLSTINHLGYIQIDTISVVQRAHHHTLWSRNSNYELSHLDRLVEDKKVFEYWSHAAAFLPMDEYRYSLIRKQAFLNGEQKHWYERDEKQINYVLNRISKEGPLMAKDFENTQKTKSTWSNTKPAKKALEYLFM
jgi:uncharacterized protein YcaQ